MPRLFCQVWGDSDAEPFPVKVDGGDTVSELKKLIKTKNPNGFKHIDPDNLKLWKWNQPGGVEDLDLGSSNVTVLNPMKTIEQIFENDPPQPECIHIVIKVPTLQRSVHTAPQLSQVHDIPWYISVTGPLRKGDHNLKYPPIERQPVPTVLAQALSNKPSIIHGPYHSGKSTCLLAIETALEEKGIRCVFIDMEFVACRLRCNYPTEFDEYVFTLLFPNTPAPIPPLHQWLQAHGFWANPPTICFLVDEMQCILDSEELSEATIPFFRYLGAHGIPYVGVGTFQLRELNWKSAKGSGTPFNKAEFHSFSPFTTDEMGRIMVEFQRRWQFEMDLDVQLAIMKESSGHAASFMALLKMSSVARPTAGNWRAVVQTNYQDYLNGVSRKIKRDLSTNVVLRDTVRSLTLHAGGSWAIDRDSLTPEESQLLNMGILLLASFTQMKFTSILILRVCIDIVFPKLGMDSLPNDYIDHPINLLKVALQHTNPRRLKNLLTHNRHGPSESAFQFELYAILRSILPEHWLCTSEARIHAQQKRLDLLVQDGGNPWAGFELKVNLISEAEFREPLRQAAGYSQQYTIPIYLVNFISKTALLPPALRRDGVEGVNICYNEGMDEFDVHWREEEVDVVRVIDGDITA